MSKCNFNNTHYPLLTVGRCHGSFWKTMTVQRRHLIKCQTSVSTLNTKCKMRLLFIEWMTETSYSQLFVILIKAHVILLHQLRVSVLNGRLGSKFFIISRNFTGTNLVRYVQVQANIKAISANCKPTVSQL